MSWSYKIIIVYALFISMILGMVYIASKQTNEMQDENYYAKELTYQSVIDGKKNLNAVAEKVQVTSHEHSVEIKLPVSTIQNISDANIRFLRPSDKKMDIQQTLHVDANGQQFLDISKFHDGFYKVQISWKSNGKPFYYEDNVYIQKL